MGAHHQNSSLLLNPKPHRGTKEIKNRTELPKTDVTNESHKRNAINVYFKTCKYINSSLV